MSSAELFVADNAPCDTCDGLGEFNAGENDGPGYGTYICRDCDGEPWRNWLK